MINSLRKSIPKIFFYCFFIGLYSPSFAQQEDVESLLKSKIQQARELIYSNPQKSDRIADTIIQLSKKHNRPVFEAGGWNVKGILKSFTSSPDTALRYFAISEELGIRAKDKLSIAKAKQNKNMSLQQMGKYELALKTCLEALKLYEELGILQAQAGVLGDIGNILIQQERPADAINYLKEAIALTFKAKDENIRGNLYNSLGVAYSDNNQSELVIETYLEALKLAEKNNKLKNQITININLGEFLWKLNKNPDEALKYYLKAEKLALDYGDESKLSIIYQNMGVIYNVIGDAGKAIDFAKRARDLSIKTNSVYTLERIYNSLATYNSNAGNYKSAFEAFTIKDSLSKIIFDETSNKNLNQIRTKYETEKKEQEIGLLGKQNQIQALEINQKNLQLNNNELTLEANDLLLSNQDLKLEQQNYLLRKNQLESITKEQKIKILDTENQLQKLQLAKRNIIIAVIGAVLLLLVFISWLLYNRYKIKQENKLQVEVLKQQEKAARDVIQAEENERQRIAAELHDSLGQLFSAVKMNLSGITDNLEFKDEQSKTIFSKTIDLVDESCQEVRVISHQMAPNALLKSGLTSAIRDFISKIDARKLKINLETFGLQERLDQNTEAVLYRVIQESVNNVIKHSGATSLDIQLSRDEEGFNVMIEDNGKGFSVEKQDISKGIGLKNINTRVNYLKGTVEISSEIGKGTLVAIHIPL